MRERQWRAFLDPRRRLAVAGKIVAAKLRTLQLHPADARAFQTELVEARKLEDILTAEARAGAAHWMRWRGFPLTFKDDVPQSWRTFTARAGTALRGRGGTSKARHAATPIGAMHNYVLTVAVGQVTRAVIGAGLDPCAASFLHSPKPGRLSFSYDVLELHRADLTIGVFEFAGKKAFRRADFEVDAHGVVRLSAPIARDVAALALRIAAMPECGKAVKRIAAWF